jgi:hypothetical protein
MRNSVVLGLLSTLVVLGGCATASYKSTSDGFTNYGYEETKLSESSYLIKYFGAKSDTYEHLEELWHRRAKELCGSDSYQSETEQTTYAGKDFVLLPPIVYYDETKWPMVTGNLTCE